MGNENRFNRPAKAGLKSSLSLYPAFRCRSMPGYFRVVLLHLLFFVQGSDMHSGLMDFVDQV